MLDSLGKSIASRFIQHPIFLVGGSRSGTIVLLKAMGQHPEILVSPSEDPFIVDVGNMVHRLEFVSERERSAYLRTLRVPYEHIYQNLRRLALESAMGAHFGLRYFAKCMLKERINLLRKRYWCTKTFPTETSAHGLLRLYPKARFVWILRNGLDVVHSRTKFHEFRAMEFSEQCESWAFTIKRFGYLFDMPEAIVVRQEELLEDPEQVFRRILGHLTISYHPGPAEFAKTTHVHPLDIRATTTGVDVKKALMERQPAYSQWTDEQKDTFRRICAGAMTRASYQIPF